MDANLTILTADMGNASVVINTSDYNQKIGALLEEPAWRWLAKDTTEKIEIRTTLKKLTLAAEVYFYLVINHQSPLHNTSKSKIHKMRWHACGIFLDCNKWNPNQLVQSKYISVWCENTPQIFTIKHLKPTRCLTSRDRKISNKKRNQNNQTVWKSII